MKFLGFSIAILLVVLAIHAAQGQGKRGGGGRRRGPGHHRHHSPICQLVNTTDNNDILCNSTCPEFAECVLRLDKPQQDKPTIPEGLEVHICEPQGAGQRRGGRRGHSSEGDDSSEETGVSSGGGNAELDDDDDDHHRCGKMLKNMTRQAKAGSAGTDGSGLASNNPDGDSPSRRLSDEPNGDNNPSPRRRQGHAKSGPPNNGNRAINPRFRPRNDNGQGADGNGPNDP